MLVADWSPTVRQLVSPWKGLESSQCSGDLSGTDQRWGSDRSVLYRQLVGYQLQSGFQECANHLAMGLQTSPTCLCMKVSFCNKCSKRSEWYAKVRVKEAFLLSKVSTSTTFAFSLSIICTPSWQQLQHFDLLFAGAATIQWLTFWKLAKKWIDYERRPFHMLLFWLRIDRQLTD